VNANHRPQEPLHVRLTRGLAQWICARHEPTANVAPGTKRAMLVLFALTLSGAGCIPVPGPELGEPAILAENRTLGALTFELIVGDLRLPGMGEISAGRSGLILLSRGTGIDAPYLDANGCTKGDFIAYDANRLEVARHGPGLCLGQTWVIASQHGSP
jgi:hypothetical protein